MPLFGSSRPKRLFMLGWDGSPLPLLQQLMDAGDLPNLARVFETGSARQMTSSLPDVSAVAWTSINTGKNPGKHGIYGFVDRRPGSNDIEVMTSSHVRAKALWELVSDAGKRAIAINVPLSFPAQHINGVVISDFLAPSLSEKSVYPSTVLPYLKQIGYNIDTDPAVARRSLDDFLADFRVTAERRAEAVMHLMDAERWDFFQVVFMETDRLHHFMWQFMEEDDPNYGPKFLDCYRLLDALAGKILTKLSPDDELIILSDHGFTTLRREVYLNFWLETSGYLRFQEGKDKSLASADPSSRAFCLDPGRIYLNLAGREPIGTVRADAAPALQKEIAERLAELRDPDTGEPMIRDVFAADQIYRGPYRDRAPDLLVMGHDGYDVKGSFDAPNLTGRGKLVGMHKYDNATFFVRGRQTREGDASVRDVLPTAAQLLGMAAPADIDGQSMIRG